MADDTDIQIFLEAKDQASPDINRVMEAFGQLHDKYNEVAAQMEAQGLHIPIEAIEASIKQVQSAMAGMFDRIGAHDEAMMTRMVVMQEKMAEQAEKAAQREAEAAEKAAQREANAKAKTMQQYTDMLFEQQIAREKAVAKEIADHNKMLQQKLEADAKAMQQYTDLVFKQAADAEKAAQRELETRAKAAQAYTDMVFKQAEKELEARAKAMQQYTDLVFKAAEERVRANARANEEIYKQLEDMAQASVTADRIAADSATKLNEQKIVMARAAERELEAFDDRLRNRPPPVLAAAGGGGILGGGGGGIPGLGGLGDLFGGAAGAAGGAAGGIMGALGGAAQAGLNLLIAPIKGIGDAFSGMVGGITEAGKSVTNFIAMGAGFYGMYQLVMQVQQAFTALKDGVLGYQDVMVRVASLTSATTTDMADMNASILQVSMETGRSAKELGEAMYFIESHGIKGAQALELLTGAAKLSASGLGETNQIVRVVAGQMVAYGATIDQTSHYFDVFARTVQLSAVPAEEVAATFARITPLAAALHIGVDELGADFATISQTGLNASRVMTDLIAVFNNFLKGGKQQEDALKGIGLSVDIVRKTLGEQGLIAAAEQIWKAADRDINAVSQVFGDRTRALVGYLALMEDGGARADRNLSDMQNSAGKMSEVFVYALTRVSTQWQRFTNTIQAFAIAGSGAFLGDLAGDLNRINDALQKADFNKAAEGITIAFKDVGNTIMSTMHTVAESMFGAGVTMMETLANGIFAGINTALNAAVNAVADFIAGFLLGHSWPPNGPLSQGDAGVRRWQEEYAKSMTDNATVITGAATNVATAVNGELAKIGGAAGNAKGMKIEIANIDEQLLPWKLATEDIKSSYENMIAPLDRQVAAIQRIKDLEYDRQQLGFEQRDLELRMMQLRAEGDPARRAALAGQLATAQELREQHSITSQIATLNREAANLRPGRGTSPAEIADRRRTIADEVAVLHIQQQQHALINTQLLGQYETKKAQLDVDKDSAGIAHSQFELQQKLTLQPLLEQRDKLKAQEAAELDVIADKTHGLEDQRKILEAQLRLVEAITSGAKTGAGSGAGAWRMPENGVDDVNAAISKQQQKNIGDIANAFAAQLSGGVKAYFDQHGPEIGATITGAMVGGMVGGIPGAMAGAAFGPKLLLALEERGVTGENMAAFANRFMDSLHDTFSRVQNKLKVGDLMGGVDEVMVSGRVWIKEFQTSFFKEWAMTTITPIGHSEGQNDTKNQYIEAALGDPNSTRYTGLGRTIIEMMFGKQDKELNFQIAYDMIKTNILDPAWAALSKAWEGFTAPSHGTEGPGPSDLDILVAPLFKALNAALDAGLAAVDGLASRLANWLNTPDTKKSVTGAGTDLGNMLAGGAIDAMTPGNPNATGMEKLSAAAVQLGMEFGKGFSDGMIEGIKSHFTWDKLRDSLITNPTIRPGSIADLSVAKPIQAMNALGSSPVAEAVAGNPLPLIQQHLPEWITTGKDMLEGLLNGLKDGDLTTSLLKRLTDVAVSMTLAFNNQMGIHSPSTVMDESGADVVKGLNQGIERAAPTTIPIVRAWATASVLAQVKAVLLGGGGISDPRDVGGSGGGFGDIAKQALSDFAKPFEAGVNTGFSSSLERFGVQVTHDLLAPLKDPNTGVLAEVTRMLRDVERVVANMPKPSVTAPAPAPTASEPVGLGGAQQAYATGGDFSVTGSGGTDSQVVSFRATPGERVSVGGRGGSNLTMHFNITVNGGDTDEVRQGIAAGVRDVLGTLGEDVPSQLLDAWRTAKAQGAYKPVGTQSRGARG